MPALPAHTHVDAAGAGQRERDRDRGDQHLTDEHDPHDDVHRDRQPLREHRDRGGDEEHAIGGRVEDLAELAALVEVPRDVAVDPVGRAEAGGQQPGGELVVGAPQQPEEQRHAGQPHHRDHVRES